MNIDASVAQSVEQLIRNQQVACSSHVSSSKKAPYREIRSLFVHKIKKLLS